VFAFLALLAAWGDWIVAQDAADVRFVIQYKLGKHRNTMPSCHIVMRDIFVAHHVFGVEDEILGGLRDERRGAAK
jgi:hypothetical protein